MTTRIYCLNTACPIGDGEIPVEVNFSYSSGEVYYEGVEYAGYARTPDAIVDLIDEWAAEWFLDHQDRAVADVQATMAEERAAMRSEKV